MTRIVSTRLARRRTYVKRPGFPRAGGTRRLRRRHCLNGAHCTRTAVRDVITVAVISPNSTLAPGVRAGCGKPNTRDWPPGRELCQRRETSLRAEQPAPAGPCARSNALGVKPLTTPKWKAILTLLRHLTRRFCRWYARRFQNTARFPAEWSLRIGFHDFQTVFGVFRRVFSNLHNPACRCVHCGPRTLDHVRLGAMFEILFGGCDQSGFSSVLDTELFVSLLVVRCTIKFRLMI